MVFERCQLKACVNISTYDDGTAEHSEMFYAMLSRSSQLDGRIRLVNREARVTINDNDGESTVYIPGNSDSPNIWRFDSKPGF